MKRFALPLLLLLLAGAIAFAVTRSHGRPLALPKAKVGARAKVHVHVHVGTKAKGKSKGSGKPSPSTPATPVETGGVVGPVYGFFADLAAKDVAGAYQLMAPSWRASHSLEAFTASLPATPPRLLGVSVSAMGNFQASLTVTVAAAGGPTTVTVPVVNLAGPPGSASQGAAWRLLALPLP